MRPGEAAARALIEFQENELRRRELYVQRRTRELDELESSIRSETIRQADREDRLRQKARELDRESRHLDRAAKVLRERRLALSGTISTDLGDL